MGFLYCATSKILRPDHYKIGMTLCKDEQKLKQYLRKRYGTAYGCCVELTTYKKVGNPRVSEKYVHNALMQYCQGGEVFNCAIEIIQSVFDSVPATVEVTTVVEDTITGPERVITCEKVPQAFIDDFFSPALKNEKFTIDLDVVTIWLNSRKDNIKSTITANHTRNVDYTIQKTQSKPTGRPRNRIMITRECFKLLCMQSRSNNADTIRKYLLHLEESNYNDDLLV